MMIHKITPSVDCNSWLKRLDTELNEPNCQNLMKVPKVVRLQQIRNLDYKTFGTTVIYSPMSPPLPGSTKQVTNHESPN